jgi:transposase-like protein
MVAVLCVYCQSAKLRKDGISRQGKQRYRCGECGRRSCENPTPRGLAEEKEAAILAALNERMSQRAVARTFKISRNTIAALIEKKTT